MATGFRIASRRDVHQLLIVKKLAERTGPLQGPANGPKSCRKLQVFGEIRAFVHYCTRRGEARHQPPCSSSAIPPSSLTFVSIGAAITPKMWRHPRFNDSF